MSPSPSSLRPASRASFPFRRLPAETRTEIWLYALDQNIAYAAKWSWSRNTCYLVPVKRSSLDVGRTCFEARQLFEKTHQKIKFQKRLSQTIGIFSQTIDVWINEQTIFFLGQPRAATDILYRFPKSTPPVLRRVVINRPLSREIHPFGWVFNFLLRNMERSFLGIDDIVIQCSRRWARREEQATQRGRRFGTFSARADRYTMTCLSGGPGLDAAGVRRRALNNDLEILYGLDRTQWPRVHLM